MCDEITEAENRKWLESHIMARREFGLISASSAAFAMFPGCASGSDSEAPDSGRKTASRTVNIDTPDGHADAFFVYPDTGKHPAIILWPDVAGLRVAYEVMARRFAEAGYAVLAVNQYYRTAPAPLLNSLAEWRSDTGQARIKPAIAALSPAGTTGDAGTFVDWLDGQAEVDSARKIGTCGYCMGGPFTFRTAAARPNRVGALASFHGGGLVTDGPDSPHLLIPKMQAALLVAIAENDDARQPDAKTILRRAATDAGRFAEIEVYPAQHGWCTIDAPVYDKTQAEKAGGRMLEIFSRNL